MRLLLVLVSVLIAGGCATSAQQQHTKMSSTIQSAFNTLKACRSAIHQRQSAKELKSLIWFSEGEPPLSYFTNANHPTDAELAHIDDMAHASLSCDSNARNAFASAHPSFSLIYGDFITAKRSLYLGLLQKQLTYGEFHKSFGQLLQLLDRAWTESSQQIATQLNRQHFAELNQRRTAIQAFNDNLARQQAIANSRRPTTTNCYRVGNQVNCTTW